MAPIHRANSGPSCRQHRTRRRHARATAVAASLLAALAGASSAMGSDGELDFSFGSFGIRIVEPPATAGPIPRALAPVGTGELFSLADLTQLDGLPAIFRARSDGGEPPSTGSWTMLSGGAPDPVVLTAVGTVEHDGGGAWWGLIGIQRMGEPYRPGVLVYEPGDPTPAFEDEIEPVTDPAAEQSPVAIALTHVAVGPGVEPRAVVVVNEDGVATSAVLRIFESSPIGATPDERTWPNGEEYVAFAGATALGLVADPLGRLLVFGKADELAWIARVLPSGDLDPSFDGDGQMMFAFAESVPGDRDEVRKLRVGPSGRLHLLGAHTDADGFGNMALGLLENGGGAVLTFGGDGFVSRPEGDLLGGLVVQGDGKIVVAGQRTSSPQPEPPQPDSLGVALVQRFLASGALDPAFGTAGETLLDLDRLEPPQDAAIDLTLQSGRPVIYGFTVGESGNGLLFARLKSDLIFGDGFETGTRAAWTAP